MSKDEIRIKSPMHDSVNTYVKYEDFGLDGYPKSVYNNAVYRYGCAVTDEPIMGYGELGFQSKVMHPTIGDKRLFTVCNAFVCINIHSVIPHDDGFEVLYSVMKSAADLTDPKVKYHLVPRVKKYANYFDLITFDVELD